MSSEPEPQPSPAFAELALRWRVFANQTVLYTQAVAESLDLNLTDLSCVGILSVEGAITAGRLAELTGLTTGAITGVLDRLERAGYARRENDPADRRRVVVAPETAKLVQEVAPAFAPMLAGVRALLATYPDEQVRVVMDVITRATDVIRGETRRLRGGVEADVGDETATPPPPADGS
jgi:DNA-binding MarR family transcriptional regulator